MTRAALLARILDGSPVPAETIDLQLARLARLADLLRTVGPQHRRMPPAACAALRQRLGELTPR